MGMSQSESESEQKSTSESFVWDKQIPFLENLYGMASDAAGGAGQGFQAGLEQSMPWLKSAAGTLQGLADPSAQIQTQTQALASNLGDMFQNTIMPGIASNSVAAGGLGGGRQGVAQGVAAGQMFDALQTGTADITQRANAQAGQAAQALGGLGQTMFNMQSTAGMGVMTPLMQLAQILGRPTVLSQSESYGTSTSESGGFSFPGFGG